MRVKLQACVRVSVSDVKLCKFFVIDAVSK